MKIICVAASRQPALYECTGESILNASMASAELGLDCSGALGQAYLVPFYNGKIKAKEALFIPGYRGLLTLAYRSGLVHGVECEVVRDGDLFRRTMGDDAKIVHEIRDGERGDIIGAYAIATMNTGAKVREYMTREDIDAIKAMSKAGKFGPWVDFYEEMAKKTVFRRLSKWLPASIDSPIARGFEIDNQTFNDGVFASVHDAAEASAGQGRMRMPPIEAKPVDDDEYDPTADPESGYGDD